MVCNLIVFPEAENSDEHTMPTMDTAPDAAAEKFRAVMHLDDNETYNNKRLDNKKDYREFMVQICNLIAPKSMSKTSTTKEYASLFHHSPDVHDTRYSGSMYEMDGNGDIMASPLLTARCYHAALGEKLASAILTTQSQQVDSVDPSMFDRAIRKIMKNSSATCRPLQLSICKFIDDTTIKSHAFYRAPTGDGKSKAITVPIMSRLLAGAKPQRTIAISPWNSLLSQQKQYCDKSFAGTNIKVWTMSSKDLELGLSSPIENWDLLYVSIHSFQILLKKYSDTVKRWGVKVLIIDECHLLWGELFRLPESWSIYRNLAAFNMKMILMSATMTSHMIEMMAHYLGIGENFSIIGSNTSTYYPPNVSINIITPPTDIVTTLTNDVISSVHLEGIDSTEKFVNVITSSREKAEHISTILNKSQVDTNWLTSECTYTQRSSRMKEWSTGKLKCLASTFDCGIDSGHCNRMDREGRPSGIISALQCIGRIRPHQQQGINTAANFWIGKDFVNNDDEWNESVALMKAAHMFDCYGDDEARKLEAEQALKRLFHVSGFDDIVKGGTCIRKAMLAAIQIPSSDCNMCSHCKDNNPMLQQAIQAQQAINQQESDKEYVLNLIPNMLNRCFVCEMDTCYGSLCITDRTQRCLKCHGKSRQRSIHNSEMCKARYVRMYGNSHCVYCYLPKNVKDELPDDFPKMECGTKGTFKCPLKERVKRILLYDIEQKQVNDDGSTAHDRLFTVGRDTAIWYEIMAKNMRQIVEDRRSM